ncbi:efflux RND transporter periplasmic adaptor subunit [Legionella pneumophila]|uniref:efflux RND transporter periplasmic adaptor subunit n=1 Tax=Legionella pneumophila TaxID=446 RepID=UPI00077822BA|nr:biotin/lipoyl-binding protein [Legionella pneumophila]
MKKKIWWILSLILCFSFVLGIVIYKPQENPPLAEAGGNTLIAPAFIDSFNDVLHIPSLQAGVVKKVNVKVGDQVKKGDLLFSLDNNLSKNNFKMQQIYFERAQNDLHIQQQILKHNQQQLSYLKKLTKQAVSQKELRDKVHEITMNEFNLTTAMHSLKLAKQNLNQAKMILKQFQITAPQDGIILQINAHENEFINGTQVILGQPDKVMVRVSIDERDVSLFNPQNKAYLMHNQQKIPLQFIQMSQYITGQERLRSQVQEVLYYFDREKYPYFLAGQQLDAYIDLSGSVS